MTRERLATRLFICTALALALLGLSALRPRRAHAAEGNITIAQQHNDNATYDGYLVFCGDVDEDGTMTHASWPSDDMREAVLGFLDASDYDTWLAEAHPGDGQHDLAQNAAEYVCQQIEASAEDEDADTSPKTVAGSSFAANLARHLSAEAIEPAGQAHTGEPFQGECGYWLFVTAVTSIDDAGDVGTSAIWVALGEEPSEAIEKTAVPSLTFEVLEDSTRTWGVSADANRGQSVPFRLTASLPDNFEAFDHYHCRLEVTFPAGIELNVPEGADLADLLDIKLGDVDVAVDGEELRATYEGNRLSIDFDNLHAEHWDAFGISADTTIVAEFAARLSEGAIVGSAGNTVKAQLVYTADPTSEAESGTETLVTHVFCWGLDVLKADVESDESLEGAHFTVRALPADNAAPSQDQDLFVQADGSLATTAYEHVTGDDGHLQVTGLDEGTYAIHEQQAPEGYDRLDGDVELTIAREVSDADGTMRSLTATTSTKGAKVLGVDTDEGEARIKVSDPKTKKNETAAATDAKSQGGGTKNERLPQTGVGPIAEALIVLGVTMLAVALLRGTTHRTRRRAVLCLTVALACAMAATARPALAEQGSITIEQQHNTDASYDAYRLFRADISDRDEATHISWPNDEMKDALLAFLDGHGYGQWLSSNHSGDDQHDLAQNAAEYTAYMICGTSGGAAPATRPQTTVAKSFANELAIALAADNSLDVDTATAGEAFVADEGLWLFVTSTGSASASGEAGTSPLFIPLGGSTTTIQEKSAVPTVEKEVLEDSKNAWGKVADAHVGQDVSYRLTATLPTDYNAYERYELVFHDSLSEGLDLAVPQGKEVADALSISVNGTSVTCADGQLSASYADGKLVVAFVNLKDAHWATCSCAAGSTITVEYHARLNGRAVVGGTGNANTVSLTYTNDPVTHGTGGIEPGPTTKTFCYGITLHKLDAQTEEPLEGAVFSIRATDGDGAGQYVQQDGSLAASEARFTTDANGAIAVTGIDEGSYLIHEVEPPEGYERLEDDVEFQVTSSLDGGTLTVTSLAASLTNKADHAFAQVDDTSTSTGSVVIDIVDDRWLAMPLTGQAGTRGIFLLGATSAIVASGLFWKRRIRA